MKTGTILDKNDGSILENYIDKKTLAEKLSLSVSYINKLMKAGKVRYYNFGRSVRFKYSEVVTDLRKWSTTNG